MSLLDLTPFLPELVVCLSALLLLLVGAFQGDRAAGGLLDVAALVLLFGAATVGALLYGVPEGFPVLKSGFVMDPLGGVFKILVLVSAFVCVFMSRAWLVREGVARAELPALLLLGVAGMMFLLSATTFLTLYIGFELQSLALYVLAAFHTRDRRSAEAGVKYVILGALASGFMLYGISLIYGSTGSLTFEAVAAHLASAGGTTAAGISGLALKIGLVFVLAGLLFKMAIVPFHMWAPDVYEGAPTPMTAFFSTAPKVAVVGLIVRLLGQPFVTLLPSLQIVLAALAGVTLIVGALGGIGQTNLKRLLAYSSIGQAGFVLAGLSTGHGAGFTAAFAYLLFYVVMSLGVFALLLCLRRRGQPIERIDDLAGLSRYHPGLAAAFAVLLFSLAGIPPLVGFFTKLYVLLALLKGGMVGLAVVGAIASVIAAFYYLSVIRVIYMDRSGVKGLDQPFDPAPAGTVVVTVVLTGAGLALMGAVSQLAQYAFQALVLIP